MDNQREISKELFDKSNIEAIPMNWHIWKRAFDLGVEAKESDLLNENDIVSKLPKHIVSNKGDYVEYKGGSTSKLLIKGNKYRLTCSPWRNRIAVINESGARMNTLKKYFDCC